MAHVQKHGTLMYFNECLCNTVVLLIAELTKKKITYRYHSSTMVFLEYHIDIIELEF